MVPDCLVAGASGRFLVDCGPCRPKSLMGGGVLSVSIAESGLGRAGNFLLIVVPTDPKVCGGAIFVRH